MTQLDTETIATNLERVADREATAMNQALRLATPDARSAYAAATTATANMRQIGGQSAAIAAATTESATLAGQGFAEASRQKLAEATTLRAAAEAALTKASSGAHGFVTITEAVLKASVVPPTAKDAASRQLHRNEIDRVVGAGGFNSVTPLALLAASEDDSLTGEAFSDYSRRRLTAGMPTRDADEAWRLFTVSAVARIVQQPRHAATAAALAAIGRAHGGVDAQRQAQLMRLK